MCYNVNIFNFNINMRRVSKQQWPLVHKQEYRIAAGCKRDESQADGTIVMPTSERKHEGSIPEANPDVACSSLLSADPSDGPRAVVRDTDAVKDTTCTRVRLVLQFPVPQSSLLHVVQQRFFEEYRLTI